MIRPHNSKLNTTTPKESTSSLISVAKNKEVLVPSKERTK